MSKTYRNYPTDSFKKSKNKNKKKGSRKQKRLRERLRTEVGRYSEER